MAGDTQMSYITVLQCCYKRQWFEPGDEVIGIPQSAIQVLIKSGAVVEKPFSPSKQVEKGGE